MSAEDEAVGTAGEDSDGAVATTFPIGVAVPDSAAPGPNAVDEFLARAAQAREVGLDSVWFSQRFDHDALSVAAVVGAAAPDIAIGTSVVPIYPRHPMVVSAQAQTAQAASHGRFTLGLGLGAPALVESAFGIVADRPIRHLREYLTVLNSLLRNGIADFAGQTLVARTVRPASVPGAQPPPPILVAAMGAKALAVTGELADGTLPYLAGPRTLAEFLVPTIGRAAARAGRRTPRVVAAVPVIVTDDVEAVTGRAQEQMSFYDSIPSYRAVLDREGIAHAAELAVIGDEDTVTCALRRYVDAGATEIIATQTGLHTEEDRLRTWRLLAGLRKTLGYRAPGAGPASGRAART